MTAKSMGKPIILTKEVLKKMGKNKQPSKPIKGGRILLYSSERIDPKNHVKFQ